MCIYLYVHMDPAIYTYTCAISVSNCICIYDFCGGRLLTESLSSCLAFEQRHPLPPNAPQCHNSHFESSLFTSACPSC